MGRNGKFTLSPMLTPRYLTSVTYFKLSLPILTIGGLPISSLGFNRRAPLQPPLISLEKIDTFCFFFFLSAPFFDPFLTPVVCITLDFAAGVIFSVHSKIETARKGDFEKVFFQI